MVLSLSTLYYYSYDVSNCNIQLPLYVVTEMRRRNVDPLTDPDYILLVRVEDQEGESETALSGNARVQIIIKQNLWRNPGPIKIRENLKTAYPHVIAKVCQSTKTTDTDTFKYFHYITIQSLQLLLHPVID